MTHSTDSNHERRKRDRTRRQRTVSVSVSLSDRGQTTQDFAVGIGVFILAVAFVFSFLPSIVTPYDSSVGGAETAQADRIADRALEELSSGDRPNKIDANKLPPTASWGEEKIAKRFGARSTSDSSGGTLLIDRVNIRVQKLDSDDLANSNWEFGSEYDDQPAASSARIVTVDNSANPDTPRRLVVRVW